MITALIPGRGRDVRGASEWGPSCFVEGAA